MLAARLVIVRSPPLLWFCAAVLSAIGICSCQRSGVDHSKTDLKIELLDGASKHLGEFQSDGIAKAQFRIKNASDFAITFSQFVQTSCGCADATVSPLKVLPQEFATLDMTISVDAGRKELHAVSAVVVVTGPVGDRRISFETLYSGDPSWEVVPYTMHARGFVGQVQSCVLLVTPHRQSLSLKQVSCNLPDAIIGSAEPGKIAEEGREIRVAFPMPDIRGTRQYRLTITTDSKTLPELHVPIVVAVSEPIHVLPPIVTLSNEDGKETELRGSFVLRPADPEVEILSVDADHEWLLVEVEDVAHENPRVSLVVDDSKRFGESLRGKVDVEFKYRDRKSHIFVPWRIERVDQSQVGSH